MTRIAFIGLGDMAAFDLSAPALERAIAAGRHAAGDAAQAADAGALARVSLTRISPLLSRCCAAASLNSHEDLHDL